MNISTDPGSLYPSLNKPASGYEWWYFDGLSADGKYGFVIIFYLDNPFSTKKITELYNNSNTAGHVPAVSVSVYKDTQPVYYSFLEYGDNNFSWEKDAGIFRIGGDGFHFTHCSGRVEYELSLSQQLVSGHSVEGSISFKSPAPDASLICNNDDSHHSWNLILPRAKIKVNLSVNGSNRRQDMVFAGTGYHDHNTGMEPMKESFKDWYWGRYHFEDSTLIYYLMNGSSGKQFKAWLIDRTNQQLIDTFDEIKTSAKQLNAFGLYSSRKIHFLAQRTKVAIQCGKAVDNGPFYQRFIGNAVIERNGLIYAAQGFSEYIRPDRIYSKKFWPLVHMRLRYMAESPHWVQKSKRLYPWTW
ncbi:MAG: hypothetical protein FH748_09900 [Balneolaceae bacterium]|nr:hypothetical protein [Balneolaceae bacterium]